MLALSKFPNERQQRAREVAQAYGAALGIDFWGTTAPAGWTPAPPKADLPTPSPDKTPSPGADCFRISHEFTALMPEPLAAAKIRGFVDDLKGEVLESEPGLIRMRLGYSSHQDAPATGSTILSWFRTVRKPAVTSGQEPIEIEMMLDKPDPSQLRLHVVVAFRPMKEHPPADLRTWRSRCEKIHQMLRQYMGA